MNLLQLTDTLKVFYAKLADDKSSFVLPNTPRDALKFAASEIGELIGSTLKSGYARANPSKETSDDEAADVLMMLAVTVMLANVPISLLKYDRVRFDMPNVYVELLKICDVLSSLKSDEEIGRVAINAFEAMSVIYPLALLKVNQRMGKRVFLFGNLDGQSKKYNEWDDILSGGLSAYINPIEFEGVNPFSKWAGASTTQWVTCLSELIPSGYTDFYDQLAKFNNLFNGTPTLDVINVFNLELVNINSMLINHFYSLINDLNTHKNEKEYFYTLRNLDRTNNLAQLTDVQRASRMIFLCYTCDTSHYRFNSAGEFDAPFGHNEYDVPYIECVLLRVLKRLSRTNKTGGYYHHQFGLLAVSVAPFFGK